LVKDLLLRILLLQLLILTEVEDLLVDICGK
jgi:hypothetical protein